MLNSRHSSGRICCVCCCALLRVCKGDAHRRNTKKKVGAQTEKFRAAVKLSFLRLSCALKFQKKSV